MLPIDGVLTSRIATLGVKALCRGNARHLVRGRLLRREARPVWRRNPQVARDVRIRPQRDKLCRVLEVGSASQGASRSLTWLHKAAAWCTTYPTAYPGAQMSSHVHLVVKAEGIDGRRLHIDKAMLREWRQDFARMMREQGIAANATPRSVRGQTKRAARDVFYRTRRRGQSYALQEEIDVVKRELRATRTISDPARARLLETRKAVVAAWNAVASALEAQGDLVLGGDVRYFARHLPPVLTDRERLAAELLRRARAQRPDRTREHDRVRDRTSERAR
jgi:type IV secretion system T-DNA border endonuclease VirD2